MTLCLYYLFTLLFFIYFFFFFNDTATTEIYTLSLHDALPILPTAWARSPTTTAWRSGAPSASAFSSRRSASRTSRSKWPGAASASRWCRPRTRLPSRATGASRSPSADRGRPLPANDQDREIVGGLAARHESLDVLAEGGGQRRRARVHVDQGQPRLQPLAAEQLARCVSRLGHAVGDQAQRVAGVEPVEGGLVREAVEHAQRRATALGELAPPPAAARHDVGAIVAGVAVLEHAGVDVEHSGEDRDEQRLGVVARDLG